MGQYREDRSEGAELRPSGEPVPVRSRIFGVEIDALTMGDVIGRCADAIDQGPTLLIGVVNAAKLVRMQDDWALREAVASCDLVLADGMAVVWASRLLGRPLPERVAGIDLFLQLLALANRHTHSIYLLGATDTVLAKIREHISEHYPKVRIAGSRNGYFDEGEAESVAEAIRVTHPDLLFAGMNSPKKELFLARWGPQIGVPVCHGVGGAFDVVAGKSRRAPQLWQRLGLEWLYRVYQEPRRLWKRYLTTNTAFLHLLAREILARSRGPK